MIINARYANEYELTMQQQSSLHIAKIGNNGNNIVIDVVRAKFDSLITYEHLINEYYGRRMSNIINQNCTFLEWRSYIV